MSTLTVKFAVYGALCGGEDDMHAFDATTQLQAALDSTPNKGIVTISNDSMGGDPCRGARKSFGAVVELDGIPLYFACQEGTTVDFFHSTNNVVEVSQSVSKSAG